jgi:hypothetical protein
VSYRRTEVQDIQNMRQELRGLLQRLAALPKENVEVSKKYVGDPAAISVIGGYLNQENEILAREAAELARKLPRDAVNPTEYYGIALALGNSYDVQNEKVFLLLSEETAQDFNTEIAAERSLGNLAFLMGRADEGRVEYQKALGIFSKYPGYDPYTVALTNILTQLAWATSELGIGSRAAATQHIETAEQLLATLPAGPGTETLRSQVAQARNALQGGLVTPVAGTPLPPPLPGK